MFPRLTTCQRHALEGLSVGSSVATVRRSRDGLSGEELEELPGSHESSRRVAPGLSAEPLSGDIRCLGATASVRRSNADLPLTLMKSVLSSAVTLTLRSAKRMVIGFVYRVEHTLLHSLEQVTGLHRQSPALSRPPNCTIRSSVLEATRASNQGGGSRAFDDTSRDGKHSWRTCSRNQGAERQPFPVPELFVGSIVG
jgi:hypothetical protein